MLSDTLQQGLGRYGIGAKLRALRLRKKMGLVELGGHTGLSPAMLSKIETGRLFPTLPTLLRIAMVFGVGLDHFFATEQRTSPVLALVRRKERRRFPDAPGAQPPAYHFESLDYPLNDRRISAYVAEFHAVPEARLRRHKHPGIELLYVVTGELEILLGEEKHRLEEGDALTFDATAPHGYRRVGRGRCSAVVVTCP
jgi:transcriptional regulator with XRE-family HTH domain